MNTFETIAARRSVKHFDATHVMPEADLQKLFSAAILSPTSFNMQNWRFVAVQDLELKKQVRAAAWNQAQMEEASIVVFLCADLQSFKDRPERPERYWNNTPDNIKEMMTGMMTGFYEGKDQLQRDEAMRSCGIAAQTLMLAAKDMGYDSCPMVGFDFNKISELIKLPENHVISMAITIGKALKPANDRAGQIALDEVFSIDTF